MIRSHSNFTAPALALTIFLALTAVCAPVSYGSGMTGVNSAFLFDGGKVYFAQADASLAVLALDTGAVIARKTDIEYAGKLQMTAKGIVAAEKVSQSAPLPKVFKIDGGIVLLSKSPRGDQITLKPDSGAAGWAGYLSYLKNTDGSIVQVGSSGGKLLIGTDSGQVECVEMSTGRSLWIYVFPALPDKTGADKEQVYVIDEARKFYLMNSRNMPESGLILITDKKTRRRKPVIIVDPQPAAPYANFGKAITGAWAGTALPIVLTILVLLFGRKKQWDERAIALTCISLAFLASYFFFNFARVSFVSSIALRFAMAAPFLAAIYQTLKAYIGGRWITASMVTAVLIAFGVFVHPAFVRM